MSSWTCVDCGTIERATQTRCSVCGEDREELDLQPWAHNASLTARHPVRAGTNTSVVEISDNDDESEHEVEIDVDAYHGQLSAEPSAAARLLAKLFPSDDAGAGRPPGYVRTAAARSSQHDSVEMDSSFDMPSSSKVGALNMGSGSKSTSSGVKRKRSGAEDKTAAQVWHDYDLSW